MFFSICVLTSPVQGRNKSSAREKKSSSRSPQEAQKHCCVHLPRLQIAKNSSSGQTGAQIAQKPRQNPNGRRLNGAGLDMKASWDWDARRWNGWLEFIFFNSISLFKSKCNWVSFSTTNTIHHKPGLLLLLVVILFSGIFGEYSRSQWSYSLGRPILLTSIRIYSDLLGKHSSSSRATHIKGQNECFLFTKVPAREGAYERDRREMESLPVKEMAPVKEVEVEPKPKKR